ncbi:MAG TPA: AraC family transcriptional regulator, partial [Tistrella mobilis]|nr:AraC family transcriptional regulator [Tistrella mobilis]
MIGILIFPDFQLLDATGPASVFEIAQRLVPTAATSRMIAVEPGAVRSSSGVEVLAAGLRSAEAVTTLVVAGGLGVDQATGCRTTLALVRDLARRGVR